MIDMKVTLQPLEPARLMNHPESLRRETEVVIGRRVIGEQERGRVEQIAPGLQDGKKSVGDLVWVVHVLQNRNHDYCVEGLRVLGGEVLDEWVPKAGVENEVVGVDEWEQGLYARTPPH